jgi:hypothetical protein
MKIENGILQVTKPEIIDVLYHDLNHTPENDCYRKDLVEIIIRKGFLNAKNILWLREKIRDVLSTNEEYRKIQGLPDTKIDGFIIL